MCFRAPQWQEHSCDLHPALGFICTGNENVTMMSRPFNHDNVELQECSRVTKFTTVNSWISMRDIGWPRAFWHLNFTSIPRKIWNRLQSSRYLRLWKLVKLNWTWDILYIQITNIQLLFQDTNNEFVRIAVINTCAEVNILFQFHWNGKSFYFCNVYWPLKYIFLCSSFELTIIHINGQYISCRRTYYAVKWWWQMVTKF